jgi:rubrerythrin
MKQDRVFNKDTNVKWKCRNCGFVLEIQNAPEKCPVCDHAKSYFELWSENY